jgi:hypothetical protein
VLLVTARAGRAQRGQALLVVLVFLAAFMVLIWASLRLASDAFLGLGAVRSDTRTTYALDAGVAYGLEYAHLTGTNCVALNPPAFTLNYPPAITVTVTMTIPAGCNAANPMYNLLVTATGTPRTVRAQIYRSNAGINPWLLRWEGYQ